MTTNYCDTCGHQFSDICGTCETLEGVPVKYQGKEKPICNTCLSKELCKVVKCSRYKKQLKQTNSDKFRAMTDKELAKIIAEDPWCTDEPCEFDSCVDCVLTWLKQEAET